MNDKIKTILTFYMVLFCMWYIYNAVEPPTFVEPEITKPAFETPDYAPTHSNHPIIREPDIDGTLMIANTNETVEYEPVDKFCLAKNIYHEARGEDLLGQLAVAQVTLNRVESKRYPDTICDVVMQRYQFSWANWHKNRWSHPEGPAWDSAKQLATQFLDYGVRVDGLEAALYYHANYVEPKWIDEDSFIAQVGTHLFYEKAKPL